MDRVRFGRALGGGARDAARAILKAADAAAAPSPSSPAPSRPLVSPAPPIVSTPARSAAANLRSGGQRFGQAVWAPVAKQSGVLWLEFTGVFFGLFTLTAGLAAYKHRHDLLVAGAPGRPQAIFALAMLLVFGYFTLSSFIKASRRGRA